MDGTIYFQGCAWGPAPSTTRQLRVGDRVTSPDSEDEGATGTVAEITFPHRIVTVKWDDGGESIVREGSVVSAPSDTFPAPDPENRLGKLEVIRGLAVEAGYDDAELQHRDCSGCADPNEAGAEGLCLSCGEPRGTGDEVVVVAIREHRSEPWGYDEIELGCGDLDTAIEDARYSLRRRIADREVA